MVFQRLSVFAGGFGLDAASAIVLRAGVAADRPSPAPSPEPPVGEILSSLVDKNLVTSRDALGDRRFGLLQTVREFGLERLAASPEASAVRQAHAVWFLHLAEHAEVALVGPEQRTWLDLLELEHDNLRAAFAWLLSASHADEALRMGSALWLWLHIRGHAVEGQRWLERALAMESATPANRAKAMHRLGNFAVNVGEHLTAAEWFQASLVIQREIGNESGIADALNGLSLAAGIRGDYRQARELSEDALRRRRAIGHQPGIGSSLVNLGSLARLQGEYAEARRRYREALTVWSDLDDADGVAFTSLYLGMVAARAGNLATGRRLIQDALSGLRLAGDKTGVAEAHEALGDVAARESDLASALTHDLEALHLWRELDSAQGSVGCLEALAIVFARLDWARDATLLLAMTTAWRDRKGASLPPADRISAISR